MERSLGFDRDLSALIDGLALLGVKDAPNVAEFFRCSDSGALFDAGDLVCYSCVPAWWSARAPELSALIGD